MITTKQQAFDLFEQRRREVLEYARWTARRLAQIKSVLTIDDIRDHVFLPEGVKGVVFGAVFKDKDEWEYIGDTKTRRGTSHGRKIQMYRYIGRKPVYPVLDNGQTQLFA